MAGPLRDPSSFRQRDVIQIRRALVSVSDKRGLADLASRLVAHGVEIVSTGSTAATIRDAGVPVTEVASVTGFPEALDGRVRTLHPAIHSGLLADLRLSDHERELAELEIAPFELVVSSLYPFAATVASGAGFDDVIEQIDIGGPAMVRAAAKNHANVAIVTSPEQYEMLFEALNAGGTTLRQRQKLAADAFAHTAAYDAAVRDWFAAADSSALLTPPNAAESWQPTLDIRLDLVKGLRYGENAHQLAALYRVPGTDGLAAALQRGGKEMSYNNYVDADAALRAAYDHDEPAVAIIKHANPCGIATAASLVEAHRLAHACDPVSAYGGVIAVNRVIDRATAESIAPIFTEVVVAPEYELDALEVLRAKKNLRILQVSGGRGDAHSGEAEFRQISGGMLAQQPDAHFAVAASWTLAAGEAADAAALSDLEFAWRAVRAVKSNAILLASGGASVGIGMGQVNRVDSCRLAVTRAGDRAAGAVAASDAFFPFADGAQILIDAGVRAIVQPGGSIRDAEVVAAASAAGVTMYFTGERHFFH